jgi:hypothetical protein
MPDDDAEEVSASPTESTRDAEADVDGSESLP